MSTIPLSVLELLKCEFEPNALHRSFPAQPNNHNNPSCVFVRQTANLRTGTAIGLDAGWRCSIISSAPRVRARIVCSTQLPERSLLHLPAVETRAP
jgi:hypothetical protein